MDDVYQYLIERQAYNFEPLKFGFWKRIIKYKTKEDNYNCRKIFHKLVSEEYFEKVRINNKHYKYKFNPFKENTKREFPIILEW